MNRVACGRGSHGAARARAIAPFVVVVSLSVVAGCAGGQRKDAPVVKGIDIKGTHALSPRQIKKKIATTATSWWWPFGAKPTFDPVTWQTDLARIERIYAAAGYYQAKVVSDDVKPVGSDHRGVDLVATVSEGPRTMVATLAIRGLEELDEKDRAAVTESLPLATGDPFVEDRWESMKGLIRDRLRERGYAEANVDGQALVDVRTHEAALTLNVRPGARYKFGDIEVKLRGGGRVSPGWVWEEVRLAAPEGSVYSPEAIEEAQRRVFAMGLFASAKVTEGTPNPDTALMPIAVDAREAPPRTFRGGGGLRFDQVRNEARLIGEWSHRNFYGGMRKLTLHGEAGWAFLPSAYAVATNNVAEGARSGPIARLNLDFQQPRFLGRPSLREENTLELGRTLEQTYDATGGRFTNGVAWKPRSWLNVFPTYNLSAYYLSGPPIASAVAAPLTLGCPTTQPHCFVLLSYLEQVVTLDRRDNATEPRRGYYASLSVQEGGGPLGGDFTYVRVLPDVRGYVSVGEESELTFSGRLRAGDLFARGDSAVITRFFAGGAVSMRGFNDRRLAPMLLAPVPTSTPQGSTSPPLLTLPIGGDGMIDGSFEVRYALSSSLVVAAFADFGQVTRGTIAAGDVTAMLWAVGVGARYRTPIGPIRVDIARRLQVGRPPPLYEIDAATGAVQPVPYLVDDSCFGLGGSGRSTPVPDNLCVLHIAIGEAF